MRIFRIEGRDDPSFGPWGDPIGGLMLAMMPDEIRLMITPIGLADDVADMTGKLPPSKHDAPYKDGIPLHIVQKGTYHCGFVSIEQYHEWFETRLIRKSLFQRFKLVVREYEVADDRVFLGRHQVMFRFEDATEIRVLTKAEAIR